MSDAAEPDERLKVVITVTNHRSETIGTYQGTVPHEALDRPPFIRSLASFFGAVQDGIADKPEPEPEPEPWYANAWRRFLDRLGL